MNSANTNPSVDSNDMYLRNGNVVFPTNEPTGINGGETSVGNVHDQQLFNDAQSNGSSDAVVGNSDDDLRTALSALMIQNKILLEQLSQNSNSNLSANNNINSDSITVNTHSNRNGYFVMPDFNNSLTEFSGREPSQEAQFWINSIESVAKLHGWPESFKLEITRTKLVSPSRNWYIGRTFTSWSSFVDQFKNTFIGPKLDTVDKFVACLTFFRQKMNVCLNIYTIRRDIVAKSDNHSAKRNVILSRVCIPVIFVII